MGLVYLRQKKNSKTIWKFIKKKKKTMTKTLALIFLCCLTVTQTWADDEFNQALGQYVQNLPRANFSQNGPVNRAARQVMRRSSEQGKFLDDLYLFAYNYTVKRKRKRDSGELVIRSDTCPFSQTITCNASYIYRFFFRDILFDF